MIFAIEGPDGAGKSTLIKSIRADKRRNTHFIASSAQPPSRDHIIDEMNWLHSLPESMILFCDRYRMVSEPIYGNALRGEDLSEGIRIHRTQLVVFIYCRPPREVILKNVEAGKHLVGVRERIDRIIDGYDHFFGIVRTRSPVMYYDYTSEPFEHFIDKLFARWVK